jgi:hypothetical protein
MNFLRNYYRFAAGIILICTSLSAQGQTDSLKSMPNLLLPRFTKSRILFKSGDQKAATLNYNVVDEVMVFMQKDAYMILDNPELIDTVYMANRKFIPIKNAFYEVLMKTPMVLFKQNKVYVELEGYPTGYGAKSQTTAPNYVRQIYGANGAIDLKIPAGSKFTDDSRYWIILKGELVAFENKRQFLKLFAAQEKELNEFIKKNSIDFKDTEKVKMLVDYSFRLYSSSLR